MREVYGTIYGGNVSESRKKHLLSTFLRRYGNHMTQQQSIDVDPITADLLAEIIDAMPDNTPGLDSTSKGDLGLVSWQDVQLLSELFAAIEA